ncbi:MAG: Fic family protein [bacterium]
MPYDVDNDPYIDKTTGILRNLLGIKTQIVLDDAEAQITAIEITALTSGEGYPYDEPSVDSLKDIHKQLFRYIYVWAGSVRTVELSKGDTSFARAVHIEKAMDGIFTELEKEGYLAGLSTNLFVERLAHYYGELIALHPFREGNGRTIRTFLAILADNNGWHIAWDEMNSEENISACIAAYKGDETPLRNMLEKIIAPVDVFWGRDPYEFI